MKSEHGASGGLSRFSLDRRVTVLVLFLTMIVVGMIAAWRIPVELIPRGFDNPSLRVSVPFPDAPAKEVLDKLSIPLEEELSTVRGIDRIFTVSVTGRALAFTRFKHGTDMDIAYREVRDRVERARKQFPEEIDKIFISKNDPSGIPVYVLGVAIDERVADSYNLIHDQIIDPISRIDGVASVVANGLMEKEILIELDREKTAASGLNIFELARELGDDNFTLASGAVYDGSRKLFLRSIARYDSLEDLENRYVGPTVRLRDIATVRYEQPDVDFRVRAMSKPAVAIIVLKEGEANIREVSRKVAAYVEDFENNPRLSGVESVTLFSQGEVIDEALKTLLSSGLIGGLIAVVVLFVFLRRFRLTLIIAMGIPLSLLIGLTVMYFSGETLNLLTLLGLMLCVGLLVDNSVVVAENIHRLHRGGMGRRRACVSGASEVALAITMSTLTTIVVFLPVSLVAGPGQFFMLRLSIPVCVSVAASLLVALVFIPLCVFVTLSTGGPSTQSPNLFRRVHDRANNVLRRGYDATFGLANLGYNRLLAFFLSRRIDLVLGLAIVFALTASVAMKEVKFVGTQENEGGGIFIGVEMSPSSTLEETESWFLEAEKIIESKKEEIGLDGWFVFHNKTGGEVQGWFTRPRSTNLTVNEATKIVKDALPVRPGMKLTVGQDRDTDDEDEATEYSVVIHGEDPDKLEEISEDLERLYCRVDGVVGLKGASRQAPNELALVVDRERTQRFGVNPQAVAGIVGYALRGTPLPKYRRNGKEIPVRVRFEEKDRESLTDLDSFLVPSNTGELIPVSALTETRFMKTSRSIVRRDKRIARVITVELEKEKEEETRERLIAMTAGIDLPEGLSFGDTSRSGGLNEDLQGMLFAMTLSVVFIYLLMGFLFESFVLPLSIVLTIPLSILGVYWIHFLTGYDLDFLGVVAMVLLVGVVVNNGIVLIDTVNRLRRQGKARRDALLEATALRFRPIMMTAITTIAGMIPLTLAGANSIGLSYTSFGLTLIGGMTTATVLTLLVVPVFYTLFDDARDGLAAMIKRSVNRRSTVADVSVRPSIGLSSD